MCWSVLPYKRRVCLCGVSRDCIEVYDGFVPHAAHKYTLGVCACVVEVACSAVLKCTVLAFYVAHFCAVIKNDIYTFFSSDIILLSVFLHVTCCP